MGSQQGFQVSLSWEHCDWKIELIGQQCLFRRSEMRSLALLRLSRFADFEVKNLMEARRRDVFPAKVRP